MTTVALELTATSAATLSASEMPAPRSFTDH